MVIHTRTPFGILPSERQQITAVAAPISRDVGVSLEPMRNAVVDLLFIRIGLIVCLANTLGHNFRVALSVTGILAVRALHTRCIFEEITTKSAPHNVVELLGNEFVALLLMDLFFLLTDSSLTVETNIKRPPILELFG